MTGYGRGEHMAEECHFVVEIKSVNHRYNDISIKLPRFMNGMEDAIRKRIMKEIARGKTDVYITFETFSVDNVIVKVNEPLAMAYIEKLHELEQKFDVSSQNTLDLVARFADVITVEKTEGQEDNDFTHYYMISLSINTANMFSGYQDPHIPQSILSFTPDYVRAIYRKIFELIPCLEIYPERCFDECWKDVEDCTIENDEAWLNRKKRLNEKWLKLNPFKADRIDFTFDLYTMNQQYLKLIDKGYSLRTGSFERNYYGNDEPDISENKITLSDEEPDVPDIEDFLAEIPNDESSDDSDCKANIKTYNSDLSYIYYKGKSLNINIYHKQTELEKRQLECDPDTDYNFLRIEVQVKKSKLNTLVSKFGLKGRELQYLVTPEIERYVLEYYVSKLTGKGIYVTYDRAMNIIDNSGYTKSKKVRLKKVIEAVAKKHGIAKVLEQIEKGIITDL